MRVRHAAVLLASVAVIAAGCGSDDDSGGSGGGGAEAGASKDQLKSFQPDGKTVRKVNETTFQPGETFDFALFLLGDVVGDANQSDDLAGGVS